MRGRALLLSALIGCGPSPPDVTVTDGSTAASTSTATSTTSTTSDPTTGEPRLDVPVDPAAACAAYCDAQAACGLPITPECVDNCVNGLGESAGGPKPGCFEADAALTACLATLSCKLLQAEDSERACDPELRAMLTACSLCNHGGGWVDEGSSCYVDRLCLDALLRVDCDADTCTCSVEGVVTETCPSEGCIPEGFPATDLACCGVR
jgi:hypothetical protein